MMGPMLMSAIAHPAASCSKPPGEWWRRPSWSAAASAAASSVRIDQLHREIGASVGAAVLLMRRGLARYRTLTGLSIDATVLSYAPGFAE